MNWMWYVVLAAVVVILLEILKQARGPSDLALSEAGRILREHRKAIALGGNNESH